MKYDTLDKAHWQRWIDFHNQQGARSNSSWRPRLGQTGAEPILLVTNGEERRACRSKSEIKIGEDSRLSLGLLIFSIEPLPVALSAASDGQLWFQTPAGGIDQRCGGEFLLHRALGAGEDYVEVFSIVNDLRATRAPARIEGNLRVRTHTEDFWFLLS